MTAQELGIKDLKRELLQKDDTISDVLSRLEKASLMLTEWLTDYGFCDNPDPELIKDNSMPINHKRRSQAFKWYYEYERIYGFIDIAMDYICESKTALEKTIEKETATEKKIELP